ncbi:MAG: FecR family protein [Bacteroidota bacterium]
MSYSNYQINDFVNDEKFRLWVLEPNPEQNYFWEKWLIQNPEMKPMVYEARDIVKAIQFKDFKLKKKRRQKLWDKITEETVNQEETDDSTRVFPIHTKYPKVQQRSNNLWVAMKIASIVVLVMFLSIWVFTDINPFENKAFAEKEIVKSNPKGQKSKIFLPDGSIVHLNAGSSIAYSSAFQVERKIKLVGEAFFEVKEDPTRPFKVQSSDIVTTALGTSFNVSAYNEDTRITVSLVSGKVKVENIATEEKDTVILTPGYSVNFSRESNEHVIKQIDKKQVIAWKDGVIIFDNTPISKVFHRLGRVYGVDFETKNLPDNNDIVISGRFDNEYLNNILTSLSYTARFEYKLMDEQVIIQFKTKESI